MISLNELPESYIESMKSQLGSEFDSYIDSLKDSPVYGVRINTLKTTAEEVFSVINVEHEPIPWVENGFYVKDTSVFTKHPFYYAGLYYIQEPSAMTPVTWLEAEPDDIVLDLCAAPGGKSTQIACNLTGNGFLVTNDLSASRCKALLKNIELSGVGNSIITCADPANLKNIYPGFFDKVLVDAPCSGEGMFRKDRAVLNAYKQHGPEFFAPIQKSVLDSAITMLRPGGILVYSTCTFSRTEDEENIEWVTSNYPEMILDKMTKLYPHRIKGEGHFVARLKKLS